MSAENYDTLSLFELKKILTEMGIPFASTITKMEALLLLATARGDGGIDKPLFVSATDMIAEVVRIKKLIGRLIERGCTGQLFGPSGDGKSFVALDMSMSIATGGYWNGIQCEKGLVIYFAGEGYNGIKRRVKAWSTGQIDFKSMSDAELTRIVQEQTGEPLLIEGELV